MGSEQRVEDDLVEAARQAMQAAYAPYSGFRVGAVLEADDGRRFAGVNVENAAYPVGLCAEQSALAAAVSSGARRFRRLALTASGEEPASPCGKCRQALAEFGGDLEIVSEGAAGGRKRWTLGELLPESFEGPGARGGRGH